ncbi:hypothetical protein GCM10007862_26910 [Dyella lipolytica]|uniref:DUF3108 domain-containing protein n=1 Tax=Dyella lipolytica TaxID=1867835 RepID=A0ABW8IXZ9_9GAMM|nr:DUF3108 domain-containing protein [Dyella lipolytica]GLQ47640.1 hypothetical protein GCM10007862_26910 [Dyella lipolytica]
MRTLKLPSILLAGLALVTFTTAAFAAAPTPFTATYQVSRDGEAMGQATITLKALGNGEYEYSNQIRGTSGLAAMLGANSSDITRFRWNNNAPETESYNSKVSALKTKQRQMLVNWNTKQVSVDEGKGATNYAAEPGMVDRNTMSLALGLALRNGSQNVTLPVGVKQRVEQQQFKVQGTEAVKVPAGSFQAQRVTRTDSDKHFDAWYVPKQFSLPVKMAQSDGGDLTLELVRYSSP